jgi:hypothetical protein
MDQMFDPMRDRTRLPRPGTCEDAHRPEGREDGLLLFGIERGSARGEYLRHPTARGGVLECKASTRHDPTP